MSLLSTEETERRAHEQVGKTLNGKYQLDELLGVGGMAAVYAATHRNGNRVAIKLLYPELSLSADVLTRFIREGYAANRVGHGGAVRVLDDDRTEDGWVFLVMELLEGEPIDVLHASRGRHIAVADLLRWTDQLLDVLAAAHDKGIVHRDIKPENLFLTRSGMLKVLDFGIARMKSAPSGASVTHTGNQFGTPPFMSPEQALGRIKEIDARSDLYAVGATMFYLLSGQDVHPAESANEMLVLAATKPARSLGLVVSDIPPALVALVDKALSFDRDRRWTDAREMQSAVRKVHVEVFGEPLPPLPDLLEGPHNTDRAVTSARGLRIRSSSSDAGSRSSAETVAAPSVPPDARARRELLATAPPISKVPQGGAGSTRWIALGAGAVAVVLLGGFWALHEAPPVAGSAPAASARAASGPATNASQPPSPAATEPGATAAVAEPRAADSQTAAPAETASSRAGVPAPPGTLPPRRRPKTPAPSSGHTPADNSAFEHQ